MHSTRSISDPNATRTRAAARWLSVIVHVLPLVARRASQIVALFAVALVLAAMLPGLVGFHNVTITGGSMGNALPVGSVAVTRTIAFRDVRVGDIIAFKRPGGSATVVHRVVEINDEGTGRTALTRGDANADNDPDALPLDQGSGDRVVYDVPWVGYAFVFMRTPGGVVALIVVATYSLLSRRSRRTPKAAVQEIHSVAA